MQMLLPKFKEADVIVYAADGMREMIKAGETRLIDEIVQAAREAGSQILREGKIADETKRK